MRLDVDHTTESATSDMCGVPLGQAANYAIPDGNPRKGQADYCGEIWALGLRNPFRFSFDRQTGDMLIGDVGYNTTEEIDFQPAASSTASAFNYGWRTCEGSFLQGSTSLACTIGIFPIVDYFHSSGAITGIAVIGGHRYRGPIPGLVGTYLFSDLSTGGLFYATENGGSWSLARVVLPSGRPQQPYGFGEDTAGNVYVADNSNGTIYRFTSATEVVAKIFDDGFEDP
jgi:glucose/arabinose dehydrogenase